jgi:hypothetical protein
MSVTGDRLGAAQRRGHAAIDAAMQPLSLAVADAVLRHATPDATGTLMLTDAARRAVVAEVGRLYDLTRPALFRVILAAIADAVRVAQTGVDSLSPLEAAMIGGTAAGQVNLSLASARPGILRQTDALLQRVLPVAQLARLAKQYFLHRNEATGILSFWPGRANMASERARMVMLTETTAAHGRAMQRVAQRDGRLLRYTLSLNHRDRDECDAMARQDTGFGSGVYRADDFPGVPRHPRCRCYAEDAGKDPTFPAEQFALTGLRRGFPIP